MAAASQQMATISAQFLHKLLFCILKGTNFEKKVMGMSIIFIECSDSLGRMNAKPSISIATAWQSPTVQLVWCMEGGLARNVSWSASRGGFGCDDY